MSENVDLLSAAFTLVQKQHQQIVQQHPSPMAIFYDVTIITSIVFAIGFAFMYFIISLLCAKYTIAVNRLALVVSICFTFIFCCNAIAPVMTYLAKGEFGNASASFFVAYFASLCSRFFMFPVIPSIILLNLAKLKNTKALKLVIIIIILIIIVLSARESVYFFSPHAIHHTTFRYTSIALISISLALHLLFLLIIGRAEHVVSPTIQSAPLTSKLFTFIALNLYIYNLIETAWVSVPLDYIPSHLHNAYAIGSFIIFVLVFYLLHLVNAISMIVYLVKSKKLLHEGDVLATMSAASSPWSQPTSPESQGFLQQQYAAGSNGTYPYYYATAPPSNEYATVAQEKGVMNPNASSFQYVFPPQRAFEKQQQGANPYVVEYYHQQQQQMMAAQHQQQPVHYYNYGNQ